MAPSGEAYYVDWVLSNNSTAHVAQHRDWFSTFTEFQTHFGGLIAGPQVPVLGIGDVHLEVKTSLNHIKRKNTHTIVLKDVLYAPSGVCNILGAPIFDQYHVLIGPDEGSITDRETGVTVGLLDSVRFHKLLLKGHGKGRTSFKPGGFYAINAIWPDEERRRWHAFQAEQPQRVQSPIPEKEDGMVTLRSADLRAMVNTVKDHLYSDDGDALLTGAEMQWLKTHYGGEFKFLQMMGLKIGSDNDRAEGRQIVRAFMAASNEDEMDEVESEDSFLADLEADPMSHVADRHFTHSQLDWLKPHYGHSGNFMLSYGLKPFDDADCRQAKAMVEQFMDSEQA